MAGFSRWQDIGSGTQTIAAQAGSPQIGRYANGGGSAGNQDFLGLIDDVAIWNDALSGDELKGLFDVGNSGELARVRPSPYDRHLARSSVRAYTAWCASSIFRIAVPGWNSHT